MNKILKRILIGFGAVVILLVCTIIFALIKLNIKTMHLADDYSSITHDPKYHEAVSVENVKLVKQNISCGYAVIEMFAKWAGKEDITEQSLYDIYNTVVTSTGDSFEKEMNKQFPEYKTTMYRYLKNSELLDKVYTSLAQNIPVPFEWAAKNEDEWTLHYSLITAMDAPNDLIVIQNPYGYEERITIKEFLNRTSFEAYENMPLFIKLGFAFDIFDKNTVFISERK
ncbi:hypothetical protein J6X90_03100 [Candidatus Saccharibacteria bacterium]|nr:hypothetical protein [Candidatus Saccharibacteria bacterium]